MMRCEYVICNTQLFSVSTYLSIKILIIAHLLFFFFTNRIDQFTWNPNRMKPEEILNPTNSWSLINSKVLYDPTEIMTVGVKWNKHSEQSQVFWPNPTQYVHKLRFCTTRANF